MLGKCGQTGKRGKKSIEDSLDLLKVVGKTSQIFLSNGRESHDVIYQNPPTKQTQAMEILPWRKTSRWQNLSLRTERRL